MIHIHYRYICSLFIQHRVAKMNNCYSINTTATELAERHVKPFKYRAFLWQHYENKITLTTLASRFAASF